jgi:hypothetical protein
MDSISNRIRIVNYPIINHLSTQSLLNPCSILGTVNPWDTHPWERIGRQSKLAGWREEEHLVEYWKNAGYRVWGVEIAQEILHKVKDFSYLGPCWI